MREWSVELVVVTPRTPDEELAELLIDHLGDRGPAVSLETDRVCVRFDVEAATSSEAFQRALALLRSGFPDLFCESR